LKISNPICWKTSWLERPCQEKGTQISDYLEYCLSLQKPALEAALMCTSLCLQDLRESDAYRIKIVLYCQPPERDRERENADTRVSREKQSKLMMFVVLLIVYSFQLSCS
jgi:hypothetical protein